MADWRRYTGTKTLQMIWTVVVFAAVAVAEVLLSVSGTPLVAVGGGLAWVVGLVVLGLRDRRHWNRMVEASTFESDPGAHTADLQKIIQGQSVTVKTDVSGILAQAHTRVRANVEGVDASFKIRIRDVGAAGDGAGLTTGNDALDDRFAIEGSAENVKALLSTEVQAALMDVETPGEFTVTATHVDYEMPFTRLSGDELDAAGRAVAIMAARIEALAQG